MSFFFPPFFLKSAPMGFTLLLATQGLGLLGRVHDGDHAHRQRGLLEVHHGLAFIDASCESVCNQPHTSNWKSELQQGA